MQGGFMFPLAHNYMTNRLLAAGKPPFNSAYSELDYRLMLVGSILPDFVAAMGLNRNLWHSCGTQFYQFAQDVMPAAAPLAVGVALHGIDGCGFDTYADEVWQKKLGWCFLKCLPYIPDAVLACNLPREYALWKAHNLVEMAAELEIAAKYPNLGPTLMAALHDEAVMQVICVALGQYAAADDSRVRPVLQTMDKRFSILEVSAEDSAEKYLEQLKRRHNISGGSVADLAALLEQIRADLKDEMWQWFDEVYILMSDNLAAKFA